MNVVFFCGHKSRYGRAHLLPIIDSSFKLDCVVLATDSRWKKFRRALNGTSYDSEQPTGIRTLIEKVPKRLYESISKLFHAKGELGEKEVVRELKKRDIEIFWASDVNSEHAKKKCREYSPSLIISAAYPQIFGRELLTIPSTSAVNFHPSALPKFRGAHPHYWAIREGADRTGVTAHKMTTNLDDGPIICQRTFACGNLNYSELYDKMVEETPRLVTELEEFYLRGNGDMKCQKEEEATYYESECKIHNKILWKLKSNNSLKNIVRTGRAFFFMGGEKIIVREAFCEEEIGNVRNSLSVTPGTVVDITNESVAVKANRGYLCMSEFVYRGLKCRPVKFAKLSGLNIGQVLE
jgi:methionyl-tRNA formyltransferase